MTIAQITDILAKLSDERKGMIYRLVLDMLSAQEMEGFDEYSIEEVREIEEARRRIAGGNCLTFNNAEELMAHFDV